MYLAAKTEYFEEFARPIPKWNLQWQSLTNTVTCKYANKTWILQQDSNSSFFGRKIRVLPICSRSGKIFKPSVKLYLKSHLEYFIAKSGKTLLRQKKLLPCLTTFYLLCSHVTFPAHIGTACQSSQFYDTTALSYPSHFLQIHTLHNTSF